MYVYTHTYRYAHIYIKTHTYIYIHTQLKGNQTDGKKMTLVATNCWDNQSFKCTKLKKKIKDLDCAHNK